MERAPRFRVLGGLEVDGPDGVAVALRGTRQRRLLAALLLEPDDVVPVDRLAEVLWGGADGLPQDLSGALYTQVFRLRQLVGEEHIRTAAGGYRIVVGEHDHDARRFERLVRDGSAHVEQRLASLDAALALWRGTPYEELVDVDAARIEAARLEELHARAREERFDALLGLGRAQEVIAELHAFADEHPLRERPCELLMQALAGVGRSADALRAYEAFRRRIAEELGIEPSNALQQLERHILDGRVARAIPAAGEIVATRPVPVPSTALLGRDADLDSALELLERHRVVTLVGTGGVGKTRLALEVGRRLEGAGEHVVVVELAAVSDADGVAGALAGALGLTRRGAGTMLDDVTEFLRDRRLLLLLDNCEHVLDTVADVVERVVRECPGVRVLATSRERVAVEGERLHHLGPLTGRASIDLFVERARSLDGTFSVDDRTAPIVSEICTRLDGLPLAIELAAARVHTLDVRDIAQALDRRFRLLTAGRRTVVRHRSLRAAVDWSYELLDPEERRVFDHCSVFAGSFDANAVGAVLGIARADAEPLLAGLVDRSLLVRQPGGPSTRFVMLETLRDYADERLGERGDRSAARGAYARHYLALAEQADADLRGDRAVDALDRFDTEIANLRAAYRVLVDRDDVDGLLRLTAAVHRFAWLRMRPEVLEWADAVARRDDTAGSALRSPVAACAALGLWMRGEFARAQEIVDAVRRDERLHDKGEVSGVAGTLALSRGELREAIALYGEAVASPMVRSDPLVRTVYVGTLALAHSYAGDVDAALADGEALLDEVNQRGNIVERAWARYALGEALLDVDPPRALTLLEAAVEDARTAQLAFVEGVAGSSAASLHLRFGEPKVAAARYRLLLERCLCAGVWSIQWTALRSVVELLCRLDAHREAAVMLGAVTAPATGAPAYGSDAARLDAIERDLERRLGARELAAARAEGAAMSDDEVVRSATATLDRLTA